MLCCLNTLNGTVESFVAAGDVWGRRACGFGTARTGQKLNAHPCNDPSGAAVVEGRPLHGFGTTISGVGAASGSTANPNLDSLLPSLIHARDGDDFCLGVRGGLSSCHGPPGLNVYDHCDHDDHHWDYDHNYGNYDATATPLPLYCCAQGDVPLGIRTERAIFSGPSDAQYVTPFEVCGVSSVLRV